MLLSMIVQMFDYRTCQPTPGYSCTAKADHSSHSHSLDRGHTACNPLLSTQACTSIPLAQYNTHSCGSNHPCKLEHHTSRPSNPRCKHNGFLQTWRPHACSWREPSSLCSCPPDTQSCRGRCWECCRTPALGHTQQNSLLLSRMLPESPDKHT